MAYGIVYRVLQPLLVVLVHNRQTRRPSTGSTEIPDRNDPAFERRALGAEDLSQGADRGLAEPSKAKRNPLRLSKMMIFLHKHSRLRQWTAKFMSEENLLHHAGGSLLVLRAAFGKTTPSLSFLRRKIPTK